MTNTNTTTETYLERVYARLEERDNPIERELHDALTEASNFVHEFSAGCNGTNDVPAIYYGDRPEPGYCECKVDGDEAKMASTLVMKINRAANAAERTALTPEQKAWLRVSEWREAGIDYFRGLPVTTVDLIETAKYVALRLNWITARSYRSDHAGMIRELREGELA